MKVIDFYKFFNEVNRWDIYKYLEKNFGKKIKHYSSDVEENVYEVTFYLDKKLKHVFLHAHHGEDGWEKFYFCRGELNEYVKESKENKEKAMQMFEYFNCIKYEFEGETLEFKNMEGNIVTLDLRKWFGGSEDKKIYYLHNLYRKIKDFSKKIVEENGKEYMCYFINDTCIIKNRFIEYKTREPEEILDMDLEQLQELSEDNLEVREILIAMFEHFNCIE